MLKSSLLWKKKTNKIKNYSLNNLIFNLLFLKQIGKICWMFEMELEIMKLFVEFL